ncbi:sensor histidine kinase [Ramlibacter sp.]|uniref:sensor histidine kinase n=1 Tax=Ramlibacter sp. TaxID=1917967 RepID=UPI002CE058ED|nr:ATP-binding protein [Ramlibacter sp.]HWI81101.1 ATP-binding protein [Ramlibacter sp.]
MATKELFAASISLVLCRVLMEVLARIDEGLRVPPQFVLLANCGLVLLLVAGYGMQLLGEERVVRAERDRIAGDLHDGLGFHLTTALALAGNTRKTDAEAWLAVDLALMELHSVIHFMHSESVPIVHTMGSLRGRLQKVVERQGLELVWRVRDDIPSDVLRGAAAYHFTKIVQEALSNVMQHAHATRLIVELSCAWPPGALVLRIVDNGRGIGQSAPSGRGLEGMARRAGLLGGTLRIEQVPEGGTCVWLSVPWQREGLLSAVTQRATQHHAS